MTTNLSGELDLHGERAALRGNPSFVWRAGQDRRLNMMLDKALRGETRMFERVLVDGCGVGTYVKALQAYSAEICGIDIEAEHLKLAVENVPEANFQLAACEGLPYPSDYFELVLSHEVLEHVQDDRAAAGEIVRVLKPGGRAAIFVPNRWYPFETHGHYWRGEYHFGNTPLINYLPDGLRNQLAPHVQAYSVRDLLELFIGEPVRVVHLTQIFPGYDNIVYRWPTVGNMIRQMTYSMEQSPLTILGISHFLVIEKVG
jgi:SAM-dependent methyltransferase